MVRTVLFSVTQHCIAAVRLDNQSAMVNTHIHLLICIFEIAGYLSDKSTQLATMRALVGIQVTGGHHCEV